MAGYAQHERLAFSISLKDVKRRRSAFKSDECRARGAGSLQLNNNFLKALGSVNHRTLRLLLFDLLH